MSRIKTKWKWFFNLFVNLLIVYMEVNSIKINLNCFEKSYFINEKYLQSITEDDDFKEY